MGRLYYYQYLKDEEGEPIQDAGLNLYLTGTETEATLFSVSISGSSLNQSTWVTDNNGFFDFYIGDEWDLNGYSANQYFDLEWTSDSNSGNVEGIQLFPFMYSVDETDSNDIKNKLLNNELAYQFEQHIDKEYTTDPHSIYPVDTDDPYDSTYNKVVSNELMYRIDNLLNILLTEGGGGISISTSGALVESILLSAFSPSGDGYYIDLDYNINRDRMYPILQFYEYYGEEAPNGSNQVIYPREIQNIDNDTVRVWTANDNWLMATVVASGR